MVHMREMRRKEKAIETKAEMERILLETKYVTIAMCKDNEPYLVTISHGYDSDKGVIYFHCAKEGKKIDILKSNNVVWGQALIDKGYVDGKCDHLYATTQFRGRVTFIDDIEEKRYGLLIMINHLEPHPGDVIAEQVTRDSLKNVNIGRIDIEYLSGKHAENVQITL